MNNPRYIIIGIVAGGVLGYLYYRFIGCATGGGTRGAGPGAAKDGLVAPGACPLTSKPVPAILYGAFIGAMIGGR